MPKLTCVCGEIINLSSIPNPAGFKIVSELVLETLIANLAKAHDESRSESDFLDRAYRAFHLGTPGIAQAYECSRCKRLAVFPHASNSSPALWFRLENVRDSKHPSLSSLIGAMALQVPSK
jgi:hypothetical protein